MSVGGLSLNDVYNESPNKKDFFMIDRVEVKG